MVRESACNGDLVGVVNFPMNFNFNALRFCRPVTDVQTISVPKDEIRTAVEVSCDREIYPLRRSSPTNLNRACIFTLEVSNGLSVLESIEFSYLRWSITERREYPKMGMIGR